MAEQAGEAEQNAVAQNPVVNRRRRQSEPVRRGPKEILPIREHFESAHNESGNLAAKCQHCGAIVTRSASTMYNHLQKCASILDPEKAILKRKYVKETGHYTQEWQSQLQNLQNGNANIGTDAIIQNMRNSVFNGDRHVMVVSNEDRMKMECNNVGCIKMKSEHLDLAQQYLANWTFDKTIAPEAFNSDWWHKFISVIRPDFKTPSSGRLLGDLLDNRYKDIENIMNQDLKSVKTCTLGIDGSSDGTKDGITNITADVGDRAWLLDSISHGEEKQDADEMVRHLYAGRDRLAQAECKETMTMSDSCNTTKSGRTKYEEQSGIIGAGCASHAANGMNKGIFKLPQNSGIQSEMSDAQTSMRGSKFGSFVKIEIMKDKIIEEKKKNDANYDASRNDVEIENEAKEKLKHDSIGIPSAGNTRQWNNQYKIIDWQLKHKSSILKLRNNRNAMLYANSSIMILFNRPLYWLRLSALAGRTDVFKRSLLLFQNNGFTTNLADAIVRFRKLEAEYRNNRDILRIIRKNKEDIECDMHNACLLLDPRYHGSEHITNDVRESGLRGLKQLLKYHYGDNDETIYNNFYSVLQEYEARYGIFGHSDFTSINIDTPLKLVIMTYRGYIFRHQNTKYGLFFSISEDIIRKRPGNTFTESTFNPLKTIHTRNRNKLGKEVIHKLLFCNFNGKVVDGDDILKAKSKYFSYNINYNKILNE